MSASPLWHEEQGSEADAADVDPAGPQLHAPAPLQVELHSEVRALWTPPAGPLTRWARAALGPLGAGREISVRIVGRRESQALNGRFRGRNKPTNVLSFPVVALPGPEPDLDDGPPPPIPLGDLVLCAAVVRDEARAQGKPLRAHWAHLVVHGALHLVGYDHEQPRDATRMESLEVRVLRRLGFPDPYRSS